MNGIYPKYVGPSIQSRYDSLYPSWVLPARQIVDGVADLVGQIVVFSPLTAKMASDGVYLAHVSSVAAIVAASLVKLLAYFKRAQIELQEAVQGRLKSDGALQADIDLTAGTSAGVSGDSGLAGLADGQTGIDAGATSQTGLDGKTSSGPGISEDDCGNLP